MLSGLLLSFNKLIQLTKKILETPVLIMKQITKKRVANFPITLVAKNELFFSSVEYEAFFTIKNFITWYIACVCYNLLSSVFLNMLRSL